MLRMPHCAAPLRWPALPPAAPCQSGLLPPATLPCAEGAWSRAGSNTLASAGLSVTPPGVGATPPSPCPLYRAPTMMGRSISFSRNCTSTSWPMRGRNWLPMPPPAARCATRTQHVALPSSCQWKRMRTRPSLSQWISLPPLALALAPPSAPTTMALWLPQAVGFGWWRTSSVSCSGRHGVSAAMASR
ncbi:hypothetical protein D3C72_959900 [compost metagenome]